MASTRFLFAAFMLLLSLVVIASANDYGNAPKPDYNTPKPEYEPTPTKPDYNTPKPEGNYNPDLPKIPDYEKPNLPEGKDELLPTIFGIQGLVLCKSGSQYFPLKGAVARITCVAVDENGYETAPFSILSNGCDGNGYFFATLSPYSSLVENKKIKECKAFLDYSPLDTCKVPTDVNHGISGGLLSSYRVLNEKNMKLYSVGPFFYTSETQSVPNGAVARITCVAVDENGYETANFSILSNGCDGNGYFFATLSPYSSLVENKKIKECKAFLDYSPLDTCKIPTDVNHGISGGLLSSYHILNEKNMKLYSVGPFFYTSETQSVPNGY